MKIIFFLLFLFYSIWAADFISPKEYQESLYQNPRGISCAKCHGDGNKQILGYYTKNGEKIPFVVPSIKNIDYTRFKNILNQPQESKSIMPTYSLTEQEIKSLYNYLKTTKKEK
ncbi:c-type cytochrome [Campylobacter peloridis]|uniref:c-type cytochrome n=1 Tax=Campylobacter peloridis TaxID=488546 RepID=UPI001C7383F5|nr:c-type cytochrome [Campylobacter peloridis]MBX1886730.1 c-type cytochrome [Campylobacter peloridis]MBX2078715.1 c-type cytochrome [Campylobacter peloridis]